MAPAVVAAGAAALAADIAETVLIQIVGQAVSAVMGSALAPELLELQQESFKLTNTRALDPASSIDAYIKGHRDKARSMDDLGAAGYDGELWQALADSAGEPLPLLTLTEAWRRGFIPKAGSGGDSVSLEQGIRESRLKNKWTPVVEQLQFQLPPMGTIIEGWLRAQITEAQALDLAQKSGVDKDTATLMFKAAGRPPSPEELFTLWKRGIIPESGRGGDTLSLEQGYLETDLKDKWYEKWKALAEYRPPPRTITALQRAGAITDAQALEFYKQEGLTPELAAIYVKTAHNERRQATRELTKAELVSLYVDQAITAEELTKRLEAHGYDAADAQAEITLADIKVEHALVQRAINRVGTLYIGRKIDKAAALVSLQTLKLPPAQTERLLKIWALERADNLRHLTPAEIGWLVKNQHMSEATGLEELGNLGYGARDAWRVLTYETKLKLATTEPGGNLPPA